MNRKPRIGITCDTTQTAKGFPALLLENSYVDAVKMAGGLPFLLAPEIDPELYLPHLDGLVITGGAFDIDPAHYGQSPSPNLGAIKHTRTDFETALIKAALHRDMPMLGICGGMQLLGVLARCTMIQHLPDHGSHGHEQTISKTLPTHQVKLSPGSHLQRAYGLEKIMVNSTHHQALDQISAQVLVSGVSDDGIIEAIELPAYRFVVGVQWHPEALGAIAPYEALIRNAGRV